MLRGMLFFLLWFTLFTCQDNQESPPETGSPLASTASFVASPDQDTASYIPLYIHDIPPAEALNTFSTTVGSCAPVVVPALDRQEAIMLTKSYWVIEGYADAEASRQQRMAAIGQWIRCNPDGTFTGGHWDRQTHAGTWYLNYAANAARLTLDSNVDRMDAVWEMQALAGDQTAMAWSRVANAGFGPYHRPFSIKLIELYDRPTKAQFAGMMNW